MSHVADTDVPSADVGSTTEKRRFQLTLIKPSHYDKDGYVIQWWKAWIPSNSLAALYGLALDADAREALGPDVEIDIDAFDEMNVVLPCRRIIKQHRAALASGGGGLVCLVSVQSNQFPRALHLAKRMRSSGWEAQVVALY